MRKHDVRKWLHAVLDLLPVILIPVFMIYSHRHTIDSGFIDVPQNQVVDFNQLGKVFNDTNYVAASEDVTLTFNNDNSVSIECDVAFNGIIASYDVPLYLNHMYLIDFYYEINSNKQITINYGGGLLSSSFWPSEIDSLIHYQELITCSRTFSGTFSLYSRDSGAVIHLYKNYMLFDLTQMFGSGNEPSLTQFNEWYPNEYYDFTLSHKELLKGTSTITYADTDIMSQVVYQLYNSVDKYFNMGNVFNMTGVYDWFNLNIFNGNAPISIYIVWNIVLYEFVMDLLFLLYGLFMWFIDMVEKIMDKPFKSIK